MSRNPRIFAMKDCEPCKGRGQVWVSFNGSNGGYIDCGNCRAAYGDKLVDENPKGTVAALRRREGDNLARRAENAIISLIIRIRQMEADAALGEQGDK